MLDKDMLATFKKHLGDTPRSEEVDLNPLGKAQKIRKFGEDIKSANEFIGAAQILDIALSKLITQAQKMLSHKDLEAKNLDEKTQKTLRDLILSEMNAIIQNCSFMGTGLFDTTLNVLAGGKNIEIEISNPMTLIDSEGYEGVIAYLEDKRVDVKNALSYVSEEISTQKVFDGNSKTSYENFNAKDLFKMF